MWYWPETSSGKRSELGSLLLLLQLPTRALLHWTFSEMIHVPATSLNASLQEVVDRLSTLQLVQQQMNLSVESTSHSVQQLQQDFRFPASSRKHPRPPCCLLQGDKRSFSPTAPSGYYWLRGTGDSSVHMYCDNEQVMWGDHWWLDESDRTPTWPTAATHVLQDWNCSPLQRDSVQRTLMEGGCSSATFNLHGIQYTHVCGKIISYQQGSPDAFCGLLPYTNRTLTIDDNYVDGISLTHGRNPRKHIWTFAAALHEVTPPFYKSICPCTNIHNSLTIFIPPYVGRWLLLWHCQWRSIPRHIFHTNDPLWDGKGCGWLNTCCSFNNPPWFMKNLPSSTSDDIEMRLCADQNRSDEDISFETVDLYVYISLLVNM